MLDDPLEMMPRPRAKVVLLQDNVDPRQNEAVGGVVPTDQEECFKRMRGVEPPAAVQELLDELGKTHCRHLRSRTPNAAAQLAQGRGSVNSAGAGSV